MSLGPRNDAPKKGNDTTSGDSQAAPARMSLPQSSGVPRSSARAGERAVRKARTRGGRRRAASLNAAWASLLVQESVTARKE